jgi:hypothetical protein
VSIAHTSFASSASRAVTLSAAPATAPSEGSFIGRDIPARHVATSTAAFKDCRFHTLSAVHGDLEDTTGGAVYSNRFDVSFASCAFSGNAAVCGGACKLLGCEARFDLCNFTNNKATFEAGVLNCQSVQLKLDECIFVQNEAELYVGVLKAANTTASGEGIIFHANRAIFHSSVADLTSSAMTLTGAQFSQNVIDSEEGGIVHALKASKLKLIGCQFETAVTGNITRRRPIRADQDSKVEIMLGCVDTTETLLKSFIEGEFEKSIGTAFQDKCLCKYVSVPQAFDLVEKSIKIQSSLLTTNFIVTAAGLTFTVLLVIVLLVFDAPSAKSRWIALI